MVRLLEKTETKASYQHGFLKRHSTTSNTMESISDWTISLSSHHPICNHRIGTSTSNPPSKVILINHLRDGVSLKTPRPRGWVGAGRPSGCKSSFNKRNMYQYPHVSQLFILLPWQSRVYPEPLKVVEFVQLTTECCWGQPSDPCQRGCLTSHACVMWGPWTLNADDDDDDASHHES